MSSIASVDRAAAELAATSRNLPMPGTRKPARFTMASSTNAPR
jgi:hypothetical protein